MNRSIMWIGRKIGETLTKIIAIIKKAVKTIKILCLKRERKRIFREITFFSPFGRLSETHYHSLSYIIVKLCKKKEILKKANSVIIGLNAQI